MKCFLGKANKIRAIMHRLVVLCWAIECGRNVYYGEWLEGFTFFVGGLMLVSLMNELEDHWQYFDEMEDNDDIFIKAIDKGVGHGMTVIAAGTLSEVTMCCIATVKFIAKALAQSDEEVDDTAKCFKEMFDEALSAYCEDKGIDKDDYFKRVGFNRLD